MPHLINLNIRELYDFSDQDETWEGSQIPLCLPPPSVLAIKEMSAPFKSCNYDDWKVDFVKELISVSPNLSALWSAHTPLLGYLLEIGKFPLIKELFLELIVDQMSTRDQLSKFLAATIWNGSVSNLKISRLTIGFLDHGKYKDNCRLVVKVVNIILSVCKNYLEHLTIDMKPSDFLIHLFIPPLPHLKSLGLHDMEILQIPINTNMNFLGDVIGRALHDGGITADESVSDLTRLTLQTQNHINIPRDYFPRLQEVDLHMRKMRNNADKLMNFFALGYPCDTLPTVTKLKLRTFFGPLYKGEMSQLFQNVLQLEIICGYSDSLSNLFWTAFPKLETFKISGLIRGDDDDPNTNVIDSFFTGISTELCSKFESDATWSVYHQSNFERTMPYIGDCKSLKEFKIEFVRNLNSKFASKVTAVHGFGEVAHQTKIIFVFQSYGWSVDDKKETLRHVDPVSAFVQIQMES